MKVPDSFAESTDGILLVANGQDPVLRWDSVTPFMEEAGVPAPSSAPSVSVSGTGSIIGTYTVYARFLDRDGNPGNLSPVAELEAGGTGIGISGATNAVPIVISTSGAHGLATGQTVKVENVQGNAAANGTHLVTVIDATRFSLNNTGGNGTYTGGGTVFTGKATVSYASVPTSADPRVARRQVLRSTAGQADTVYVDVDTADLTATTFSSTRDDDTLSAQTSVTVIDGDGRNLANLWTRPPNHKSVIASHLGRMFLAGEVDYTEGCVSTTFGGTSVVGIGTEWSSALEGRQLFVLGGDKQYLISSINVSTQTLTLSEPYTASTDPYAVYAIRPARAERRLVYYSEAGFPEAWPAFNAISIQEDGDEIVGLMAKGSFLYIVEQRHVYRFTFQSDPADDGYVFLAANRGCVNDRCWVLVDDMAYMLDDQGVHAFTGGQESQHLSEPIQDLFESDLSQGGAYRINWAARRFFHAAHYPGQAVIRWFVALSGQFHPRHALAYNYRTRRWWVEEYPLAITSSVLGVLNGEQRVFLGSRSGEIHALGHNNLDLADPTAGTVRGTVTGSDPTSIADSSAAFASSLAGSPVSIVAGRGKGQLRVIASNTSTSLVVTQPWLVLPDTASKYQVGGIPYQFRTRWFRFVEDEQENPRRLELVFQPVLSGSLIDARLYVDRSGTALEWDVGYTSSDGNGVMSSDGSSDLTVDLTKAIGFAQKRFDGRREFNIDGPRFVQVELEGVANQDQIKLYRLAIDGVK